MAGSVAEPLLVSKRIPAPLPVTGPKVAALEPVRRIVPMPITVATAGSIGAPVPVLNDTPTPVDMTAGRVGDPEPDTLRSPSPVPVMDGNAEEPEP
jgi:hypothetical protein